MLFRSAARDDTSQDETSTQAVLASLETILGHSAADEPEEVINDFQPMTLALDLGLGDADPVDAGPTDVTDIPVFEDGYTIHFVPDSSLYASGNEPLHLLRLLREMGDIQVMCDTSSIPSLVDLDEEKSYLSWTIHLTTDEEEDAVREVFDFVADLCSLTITSPQADNDDTPPPPPERPPLDDTSPTEPPLSTVESQTTTGVEIGRAHV